MRRFGLVFFLVMLIFSYLPSVAQTVPDDEFSRRFAVRIAAPWKVQAFMVEASANYGGTVEPVVKARFHADLKLMADTFVLADRTDAVSILVRVGKEGEIRTIFGVATALLRGGAWQVEYDPQNDPVAGSGLPRNAFPGRLIIRGSDEEAAYFREIAATATAAHARLLEEQGAAAKVAKHRQELEAALRDDARQVAEKEAATEAAATRKRAEQVAATDAAADVQLSDELKSLPDSLRSSLTINLSQGWVPTSVSVLATVNSGTTARPEIRSRFIASLQLASDMFIEKESAPGATIVTKVLAAGEARNLAGTGVSTLVDGSWKSVAKLDVEPEAGRPQDSFSGSVLIAGSAGEAAFRRDQEQEAERKHRAQMARQALALEEQAVAARLARERQAQEATLREEARQIAEREAAATAAATLKRLEELDAALANKDPKRRRVALDKALKSSDPMVQNMALRDLFFRIKTFTMTLERDVEGKTVMASENLGIDNFIQETGEFTAFYERGRLTAVTLGVGDRLMVTLLGDTMQGRYRKGDNSWWKATIKLQ